MFGDIWIASKTSTGGASHVMSSFALSEFQKHADHPLVLWLTWGEIHRLENNLKLKTLWRYHLE